MDFGSGDNSSSAEDSQEEEQEPSQGQGQGQEPKGDAGAQEEGRTQLGEHDSASSAIVEE